MFNTSIIQVNSFFAYVTWSSLSCKPSMRSRVVSLMMIGEFPVVCIYIVCGVVIAWLTLLSTLIMSGIDLVVVDAV